MNNAEAVTLGHQVFTPNYKQQPVVLVRGQGVFAWDGDGKRYLDMIAGIASLPPTSSRVGRPATAVTSGGKSARLLRLDSNRRLADSSRLESAGSPNAARTRRNTGGVTSCDAPA